MVSGKDVPFQTFKNTSEENMSSYRWEAGRLLCCAAISGQMADKNDVLCELQPADFALKRNHSWRDFLFVRCY